MRALLISVMDDSGKDAAPLPVGLAYVGAAAERAGHSVRLLVLAKSREPESRIADTVLQFRPERHRYFGQEY